VESDFTTTARNGRAARRNLMVSERKSMWTEIVKTPASTMLCNQARASSTNLWGAYRDLTSVAPTNK
jgi:hypothetical protein